MGFAQAKAGAGKFCRSGLFLFLAVLTACQPRTEMAADVSLDWQLKPQPPTMGKAVFTATLKDASGQPVRGAVLQIEANMSHPGMVPVFGTAQEVSPGNYQTELDLTMAGDWFLLVDATLADGRTLQRQLDLPGVRAR